MMRVAFSIRRHKLARRVALGAMLLAAVAMLAPERLSAKRRVVEPSYAWKALAPLGLRQTTTIDTAELNYYRQAIPSEISDAWVTTGNLGAEGMNMIFEDRLPMSDFFLGDAVRHWHPEWRDMKFYNTRIPMTLLSYNTAGGRDNAQDRLAGIFSGNINRKAQVGALVDYLYSKGCYAKQSTKDLIWGLSGSYLGDRYEFQGFYNHWNLLNKESGGITDPLFILDPEEVQGGVASVNPTTIPTNLNNAHTRVVGDELMVNNRYKVGYWKEEHPDPQNDSLVVRTYVPVTSFIYTLNYRSGVHVFDDPSVAETRKFFGNVYLDPKRTHDRTDFFSVSNTVGVALLEGFHRYAKFGLAAYATYEFRRYNQTVDTLNRLDPEIGLDPFPAGITDIPSRRNESLGYVGAQLSKQKGRILTYDADGRIGLLGPAAGDVAVSGNIYTRIPIRKDSIMVHAMATFRNEAAPYLINNYRSNHFIWQNDFGKQRTLTFGGDIEVPLTQTRLEAKMTNIQNYIYFGPDFLPRQYSGNVQVFTARLEQNLHFGIFHWDNTVTYQTSTNDEVISLPKLAVYSNMYLRFRIATLKVQLGVDCDWYTRYYAPRYQPGTASFAVQHEQLLGNYPWVDVYANMKLSKVRFYVMMSHVNQGLFGGNNYFATPLYPLNPRRFQLGLSVDFAN